MYEVPYCIVLGSVTYTTTRLIFRPSGRTLARSVHLGSRPSKSRPQSMQASLRHIPSQNAATLQQLRYRGKMHCEWRNTKYTTNNKHHKPNPKCHVVVSVLSLTQLMRLLAQLVPVAPLPTISFHPSKVHKSYIMVYEHPASFANLIRPA